jgi:hypothetical protein
VRSKSPYIPTLVKGEFIDTYHFTGDSLFFGGLGGVGGHGGDNFLIFHRQKIFEVLVIMERIKR